MAHELTKNVAVISLSDLERIRRTCIGLDPKEEDQQRRQGERQQLCEKSRARMKNWGDTFEALKEKKEIERMKRFEQEELERRALDADEEAIQAQQRLKAIERANKILHDDNDQVKAFHSKMLLADVLQERELQLEIQGRKKEFHKEIEEQWNEVEKQQIREYDDRMKQKRKSAEAKKREAQRVLKKQLDETKKKYVQKLNEEYVEGQLLKKKAAEDLEADRMNEMKKRQARIEALEEAKKANDYLQDLKRQDQDRQREEESRQEEFARKKEEIMRLRKEREEGKFKDKLAARQRMIDRRTEELSNIKSTEEARLGNQMKEVEDKARSKYEHQENKRRELQNQIDRSSKQQMDRRKQEKDMEKREEQEFTDFWKSRMGELNEMERQETEDQKERAKQLQVYHKKQMDYKARKAEQEAMIEAEIARQALDLQQDEQSQFNSYAEQCLKEWAAQGKNITPLILELKNYKKRVA